MRSPYGLRSLSVPSESFISFVNISSAYWTGHPFGRYNTAIRWYLQILHTCKRTPFFVAVRFSTIREDSSFFWYGPATSSFFNNTLPYLSILETSPFAGMGHRPLLVVQKTTYTKCCLGNVVRYGSIAGYYWISYRNLTSLEGRRFPAWRGCVKRLLCRWHVRGKGIDGILKFRNGEHTQHGFNGTANVNTPWIW